MEDHSKKCFNPRAREGRDSGVRERRNASDVSIHAPVRGATSMTLGSIVSASCFNPRAREGRDVTFHMRACMLVPFQSTRP